MANFCTQCGKAVQPEDNFCQECGAKLVGGQPSAGSDMHVHFQDKRARVMGNSGEKKAANKMLYIFAVVAVALGLLTLLNSLPSKANPIIDKQPVVSDEVRYPAAPKHMEPVAVRVENGKIILPLDVVKAKKFVSFEYRSSRGIIPLLAYLSPEGKVVTAVSMCEPCNSTRFHIKSDELICNSCGTTWELDNLGGVSGACQGYPPDAIPSVVVGNEIQIDESIVAAWTPRV